MQYTIRSRPSSSGPNHFGNTSTIKLVRNTQYCESLRKKRKSLTVCSSSLLHTLVPFIFCSFINMYLIFFDSLTTRPNKTEKKKKRKNKKREKRAKKTHALLRTFPAVDWLFSFAFFGFFIFFRFCPPYSISRYNPSLKKVNEKSIYY